VESFELHVTGDPSIHAVAAELDLRTIVVGLYGPDQFLRVEHMTSHVARMANRDEAVLWAASTHRVMLDRGVKVSRVKLECPADYEHYDKESCYIETHFPTKWRFRMLPLSRSLHKKADECLSTDRIYKLENYAKFRERYSGKIMELCLYDTHPNEDEDWLKLYPRYGALND
jgi:hypothetical protein